MSILSFLALNYKITDQNILKVFEDVQPLLNTLIQYIHIGSGTPEGNETGSVGHIYLRTNGGANTTLYVKESGTAKTGWIAK